MWYDPPEAAPAAAFRYLPFFRALFWESDSGTKFECYNPTARAASARVLPQGKPSRLGL
jgi:hypothetical protein